MVWSLGISIKAAKGESVDEPDDLDKEINLLKKKLNKEDVLSKEISIESIIEAFKENIFPLFIMIEDQCSHFKDYFFTFDRQMAFQTNKASAFIGLGSNESKWEIIEMNWFNRLRSQDEKVTHFKYNYTLKGLKKAVNAPNISLQLDFYFNDYNYYIQIRAGSPNNMHVPYGTRLSDNELTGIYTPIVKEVIEDIKRYTAS
jgi:hypothetical protein